MNGDEWCHGCKELESFITAYGVSGTLNEACNIAVFTGVDRPVKIKKLQRDFQKELLMLLDKYDLYGKASLTRTRYSIANLGEIYRIAARGSGILVDAFTPNLIIIHPSP
jgi:hypothetical protein